MQLLIYLSPLVLVIASLATRRVSLLQAGCIGVLATIPAAWTATGDTLGMPVFVLAESLRGAWIAWQAISIIIGGLVLYQVLRTARPDLFAPRDGSSDTASHRQLFTVCMMLGPFVEAATGFGVGYLITLTALTRMGVPTAPAIAFGIFSQMLVPWGALGVGTFIGAELGDIPVRDLGVVSSILSVPLLLGFLAVFWWMTHKAGRPARLADMADDLVSMLAMLGLLYLGNLYTSIEVAALLATGPVLVARYLREVGIDPTAFRRTASAALPYAVLTLILVATRTIPSVQSWLSSIAVIQPEQDLPIFPVFYHPFLILILVSIGYGLPLLSGRQWREVMRNSLTSGRVPVLVTLVFMIMAQMMGAAGIPAILADAWVTATQSLAVAAVPVMGMVAGALTGSNTASNGLLMGLQIELAGRADAAPLWIAGIQNVAGCNAILVSPIRVAMGCAIVGFGGRETQIYPWVWPLGLVVLVVLEVASFWALR